jgi:hypothetical protein
VMGLTWGFGALSINNDTVIFQYIFAVLNSFQVSIHLLKISQFHV